MHAVATTKEGIRRWLAASLAPAPDSSVAANLRRGKSPWSDWVHLLWSVWLFITPLFGGGHYTSRFNRSAAGAGRRPAGTPR